MRYEIPYVLTGKTAKNKAMLLSFRPGRFHEDVHWVAVEAASDAAAYEFLMRAIRPKLDKPISGRSYLRLFRMTPEVREELFHIAPLDRLPKYELGMPIILHEPYTGMGAGEFKVGKISEVLGGWMYSISLDGYANPFVDFSAGEFAPLLPSRATDFWSTQNS